MNIVNQGTNYAGQPITSFYLNDPISSLVAGEFYIIISSIDPNLGLFKNQILEWTGNEFIYHPITDDQVVDLDGISYIYTSASGWLIHDAMIIDPPTIEDLEYENESGTTISIEEALDDLFNREIYSHPNHSGDVSSDGDGEILIKDNVITNNKLAKAPSFSIKLQPEEGDQNVQDVEFPSNSILSRVDDTLAPTPFETVSSQFESLHSGRSFPSPAVFGAFRRFFREDLLEEYFFVPGVGWLETTVRTLLFYEPGVFSNNRYVSYDRILLVGTRGSSFSHQIAVTRVRFDSQENRPFTTPNSEQEIRSNGISRLTLVSQPGSPTVEHTISPPLIIEPNQKIQIFSRVADTGASNTYIHLEYRKVLQD